MEQERTKLFWPTETTNQDGGMCELWEQAEREFPKKNRIAHLSFVYLNAQIKHCFASPVGNTSTTGTVS